MTRYSILPVLFLTVATVLARLVQGGSSSAQQEQEDRKNRPAQDSDAIARRDFMRTKLLYTQNIFEGLTIGNWKAIQEAIEDVQAVTDGEQWVAIDDEDYRKLTEEFKTATDRLKTAAESKTIEATALRFYELSTRCIDCHQHIRRVDYDL